MRRPHHQTDRSRSVRGERRTLGHSGTCARGFALVATLLTTLLIGSLASCASPTVEAMHEHAPSDETAVANLLGGEAAVHCCRKPEIVADAAYEILTRESRECTGNFFIDSEVLAESGVTNFDQYAMAPGTPLMPDFFLGKPDFAALSKLLHSDG